MVASGLSCWKEERQAAMAASCALEPPTLRVPLRPLLESLLESSPLASPPHAAKVGTSASAATEGATARRRMLRVTGLAPVVMGFTTRTLGSAGEAISERG